MTHTLKTWPEYYKAVESGNKTFEVRRFDRPFKVGDTIILQEYDNEKSEYSGKELIMAITYILQGGAFGIESNFCVIGIKQVDNY